MEDINFFFNPRELYTMRNIEITLYKINTNKPFTKVAEKFNTSSSIVRKSIRKVMRMIYFSIKNREDISEDLKFDLQCI